MNGGSRITSDGGERKEERKKGEEEDGSAAAAAAAAFVKRCQIFNPKKEGGGCQHSCAIGDEGLAAPILQTNTHK